MRDERLGPAFGWSCPPGNLERHGTPQVPDDRLAHNCASFSFRPAEPGWPFREDGRDRSRPTNGESLARLARVGVGIARVGRFAVEVNLSAGWLVPLLEACNPQGREPRHALFDGGSTVLTRVRVFVDLLTERPGASGTG